MADIFVSYARADKDRVAPLIAALESQGFSVWWDPAIVPGQEFDRKITAELEAAKAVIVVWTPASVDSRWVRGEAREAADRGILLPVRFDNARLPLDARSLHTTDLDDWKGEASSAPFQELLGAAKALLGQPAAAPGTAAEQSRHAAAPPRQAIELKPWHIGALAAAVLIALTFVFIRAEGSRGDAETRSSAEIAPHPNPLSASGARETSANPASSAAPRETLSSATPAKPRIAVMPFQNFSPDPANAFFTDGMHEEVLTALANAGPGLEVISRTTMDSYKGKPVTVEQLEKDLDCTHVLEGSVRREGDHVRLTLQLINAKTDEHVWAQDYDRTLKDSLALQSEVAGEVAKQLSVQLGGDGAQQAAPSETNPAAYDLYLKARAHRQQLIGFSPMSEWLDIKAQLDNALELDPKLVPAYIERMTVNWFLFADNYDASDERYAQARADLEAAQRLAPDSPAVLAAAGQLDLVDSDLVQALSRFEAAEARGFSDPDVLQWKGAALASLGRFDEALALYQRLIALDPKNSQLFAAWWQACILARQPAEAIRVLDLALAAVPSNSAWSFIRANTIAWFTGKAVGPPPAPQGQGAASQSQSFIDQLIQHQSDSDVAAMFDVFRPVHAYALARQMIDAARSRAGIETIRIPAPVEFLAQGLGRTPISELRGWTDLLLADEAELKKDGQDTLDYVARQTPNRLNPWFLHMLRAEGLLFSGDKQGAVATVREALKLQPSSVTPEFKALAAFKAAVIYAWAGEKDAATALLEKLATDRPGLPPAAIMRDPIFDVPLADNARYRALKAKLEAQMAATKLE